MCFSCMTQILALKAFKGGIPKGKVLALERLPFKDKSHLDIVDAESFVDTK